MCVCVVVGAVYTVKISRHPHCSCPDHEKGNLCKHILFVMLRVLKLATTNPLVWQKALLTKEVHMMSVSLPIKVLTILVPVLR